MGAPYTIRMADRILSGSQNGFLDSVPAYGRKTLDLIDSDPEAMRRYKDRVIAGIKLATKADCPRLIIDNVAECIAIERKGEIRASDFPCVVPPFRELWVEFKVPGNVKQRIGQTDKKVKFMGASIYSCTAKELQSSPEAFRITGGWDREDIRGIEPGVYWHSFIMAQVLLESGQIEILPHMCEAVCDEYGANGRGTYGYFHPGPRLAPPSCTNYGDPSDYEDDFEPFFRESMHDVCITVMFAFSLMHCKNVSVCPADEAPEAMERKRRKEHGTPFLKYRVLNIDPFRSVANSHNSSGVKTGIKNALHICRGHFKDFREKGLFGSHHGIYWWDSFARGSKEVGEIKKDYSVKRPLELGVSDRIRIQREK